MFEWDPGDLDRVAVVGTSGSGKTTFGRDLAASLGSDFIELDALHWGPRWTPRPDEQFRSAVARAVGCERWVADGNYGRVRDLVWGRATAVIWLNLSFPTTFLRCLRRTVVRAVTGQELYSGNRENLRMAFLHRDSILLWVLQTYAPNRARYRALFADPELGRLRRIELRSPRQMTDLIVSVRRFGAAQIPPMRPI